MPRRRRQRLFQRPRLRLGLAEDRRAAADLGVDRRAPSVRAGAAMKRASGRRSSAGRRRIAGSLNRLRRNGCTASERIRTAEIEQDDGDLHEPHAGLPVAHDLDELGDMLRRRLRHHAMAEIEHEGAVAELVEDARGLAFQRGAARHQHQRIEIALDADMRLQLLRRPMRADAGIDRQRREGVGRRYISDAGPTARGKAMIGILG